MQEKFPVTPYAHVTYCEDIRNEVGGSYSLIGVRSGDYFLDKIPCRLEKICLDVIYCFQLETDPENFSVRCELGDVVIAELNLGKEELAHVILVNKSIQKDQNSGRSNLLNFLIKIDGISVQEESILSTYISFGDSLYCPPRLRFRRRAS